MEAGLTNPIQSKENDVQIDNLPKTFYREQLSSQTIKFPDGTICQYLMTMFYLTYQSEYQHLKIWMRMIVWNLPQDSTGIHVQQKGYFRYLKLISTKTFIYRHQIQSQMSSCIVDSSLQHKVCLCCIIILSQLMYPFLITNLHFFPFT